MKNTLPGAICLAILVCAGSSLPLQAQGGGTNVAVIDINFIFKNHALFKAKMDDIKRDIETFEEHLRSQRTKITQQTERLKTLPAASQEFTALETSIAEQHTNLQLETSRKRKEILEREAKVYYNAYKHIEDAVALFADANGIGLVLRFSSEDMDPTKRESVLAGVNRPIVFQRQLNITGQILNQLNRNAPPPGPRQTQGGPQVPGRNVRSR